MFTAPAWHLQCISIFYPRPGIYTFAYSGLNKALLSRVGAVPRVNTELTLGPVYEPGGGLACVSYMFILGIIDVTKQHHWLCNHSPPHPIVLLAARDTWWLGHALSQLGWGDTMVCRIQTVTTLLCRCLVVQSVSHTRASTSASDADACAPARSDDHLWTRQTKSAT